jgi:hypothetical protein
MRALALKELREVAGITAIAGAVYLALVINLMGAKVFDWVPGMPAGTRGIPFLESDFTEFFMLISVLFAVALGFRQSAWELGKGTFLFLLHRPASRGAIFLTKLATGAGVLAVCLSLPIVLYGWWATVPGHHASPFEWSMTETAWLLAVQMPLLYLGAFLSGLRPGRWLGTRLLPLAATALVVVLLNILPWWWFLGLPVVVALDVVLIANVCLVARVRDYS